MTLKSFVFCIASCTVILLIAIFAYFIGHSPISLIIIAVLVAIFASHQFGVNRFGLFGIKGKDDAI